jgi:hypothetical protein
VDVVELHDCFAQNELLTYEALGLCARGGPSASSCDGDNTYGGRSSPTRRAACCPRAIRWAPPAWRSAPSWSSSCAATPSSARWKGARLALQHNLGLGGACVVTLYEASGDGGASGRLRFFAKAIGQTDPVYTDDAAARAAGHPDLPVPPTFLFCLEMELPTRRLASCWAAGHPLRQAAARRAGLQLPPPGLRGDTPDLPLSASTDIYDKKGGALEFVVRPRRSTNQRGELVAELRS